VKQNTEMESHEEKLHKMIIQSKINDTKVSARAMAAANVRCRVAAPARCALDEAHALPKKRSCRVSGSRPSVTARHAQSS